MNRLDDPGATIGVPCGRVPRTDRFPPTSCIRAEEAKRLLRRIHDRPSGVRPVIIRGMRVMAHNPGLRNHSEKE
jgi:hypothetical protein